MGRMLPFTYGQGRSGCSSRGRLLENFEKRCRRSVDPASTVVCVEPRDCEEGVGFEDIGFKMVVGGQVMGYLLLPPEGRLRQIPLRCFHSSEDY